MAASHPQLFQVSIVDESEIRKLIVNHFLPDHAMLQWRPANPTPQKKARKTTGKSAGGIKINEPVPKAPTLTPPSGPRRKISIQR
jgi:hypothetical protein